jgi:hypothetical protein
MNNTVMMHISSVKNHSINLYVSTTVDRQEGSEAQEVASLRLESQWDDISVQNNSHKYGVCVFKIRPYFRYKDFIVHFTTF